MKKYLVVVMMGFAAPTSVFAGNTSCAPQTLSCQSVYSIEHHEKIGGPAGTAAVADEQPEPFDPADCEASVVLYTDAGKFVATYTQDPNLQDSGTVRAWIDADDGKETLLLDSVSLTVSRSVNATAISTAPGSVDSVIFSCSLK